MSAKDLEVAGLGDDVAAYVDDAPRLERGGAREELRRAARARRVHDHDVKVLVAALALHPGRGVGGHEAAAVGDAVRVGVASGAGHGGWHLLYAGDLQLVRARGGADADGAGAAVRVEYAAG